MDDSLKYSKYSRYNVSDSRYNISNETLSKKAEQYSRSSGQKYSHRHIKKDNNARKRKNFFVLLIIILVLTCLGIGAYICFPIQVYVNGKQVTLTYDKSVKAAAEAAEVHVKPGDFVAVDYSVLTPGEGHPYYAEVDGVEVYEKTKLSNNAQLTYTDGKYIMEDYTSEDSKIAAKSEIKGVGAIHKFEGDGEPGIWSKMHGKISGKYVERQTKDPGDVTVNRYNINPGKDKVIALTFDDGPSDEYTQKILDLLDKYSAKATFFVIGERLEDRWAKKLVASEEEAGHQICTHSYDHARAAGGTDITHMNADKQIEEVTKGKSAIAKCIKNEVSSVVRLPGGNLNALTARLISPFVSCEVGWNIDTGDWEMPGASVVLKRLELASSGDIILCHDGGGDRSDTVEALETFLKDYSLKGYSFITIDKLMEYDAAKQESSVF